MKRSLTNYLRDLPLTKEDLDKPLLDVGTGTGKFITYVRDVLGNKNAVGVENQVEKVPSGKEGIVVGDGFELPFADETFEVVIASNYLPMFVSDPEEMRRSINELIRVTKHNGKVVGNIATPDSVTRSDGEVKRVLGEKYNEKDHSLFEERLQGANELQGFIEKLREKYQVEVVQKNPRKTVLVIKK